MLPERLRQGPERRVEPEPAKDCPSLRGGLPPPVGRGVVPEPQLGELRDGRDLDHRPQWPAVALAPRGYLICGREEEDVGAGRVRVVPPPPRRVREVDDEVRPGGAARPDPEHQGLAVTAVPGEDGDFAPPARGAATTDPAATPTTARPPASLPARTAPAAPHARRRTGRSPGACTSPPRCTTPPPS